MRKCDICHTPVPLGEKFCPKCGYKIPDSVKINSTNKVKESRPLPQTRMPHGEVKRKNNGKKSFTGHFLVLLGIVIFLVVFSLVVIRKVTDSIIHQDPYESLEVIEDGKFISFEELNLKNSVVAKEVLPYYKKVKMYATSKNDVGESYVIEDSKIKDARIDLEIPQENKIYYLSAYNYSGKVWYLRGDIQINQKTFTKEDLKLISEFCEIDLDTLYRQVDELYQNGLNTMEGSDLETYSYGLSFGDYTIYVIIGSMIEFEVVKI